ncbi:hypothetical protein H696_04296 [Fonticula alba]|uniref:ER-derived vesicles protein ERV14 n=1 Tax=Fonticula alba TaxID=691883 RepID=A0A058Z4M8_FONAL|nr:hypothetical protein H696_04296 [Fonticula alba]KCV68878.1 hypothetical protein H696_04296 [Fonticula alba]|eukprot:XP_009496449.1 hypothetical protein H696_04296 [Fonticula alba]
MGGEAILFVIAVVAAAALLFAMVFYFILFTDLESDYINPIECCIRVNKIILPEMITHTALTVIFLLSRSWLAFLLNLPLLVYHGMKYNSGKYLCDATSIFRQLSRHRREGLFKLVFYLLCFFYYLYRMIVGLIDD